MTRASSRSPIRTAILKQKGTIRTAPGQPWMPFESEQVYSLEPPGFVWLARARLAPLVHMMAKDEFLGGKGNMLIKVMGWLTVADARGPTIDQGAGLRYWGEVLAFSETVTSPYLRWEAMDDRHARLIVEQEGLTLTATIEFDAQGYLVATHGERYRDVAGRPALTPWSGYSREWKSFEGRPFPSRWEAVWHLPEGDFLGVRMEVESVLDVTASPL